MLCVNYISIKQTNKKELEKWRRSWYYRNHKNKRGSYKREILDIFFHLNKTHSTAKDIKEKCWKEKKKNPTKIKFL